MRSPGPLTASLALLVLAGGSVGASDYVVSGRKLLLKTPVAGFVGCGQAIMKLNTTARLKDIKLPVLAITGEQDGAAPGTKYIGENVPGAKYVGIPQAAHIANVEQPEAFNRALREFL